mgnify:CR=1 FL=1
MSIKEISRVVFATNEMGNLVLPPIKKIIRKKISHTDHMHNLFLQGRIYQSMHFPEMAQVMTHYGLQTSEMEAMDAYDDCMFLGYPRGGNPSSWDLNSISSRSSRWLEYSECSFMSCSNEVKISGDLCTECISNDQSHNDWVLINQELNSRGSKSRHSDKCCGQEHTKYTCTQCHGPLCMTCIPRIPVTGTFMLQHYECMSASQRKRYEKA